MKFKNRILLCCIVSLLCLGIFTGCHSDDGYVSQATSPDANLSESPSTTSEESSENNQAIDPKVARELREGADVQPGAKTEDSVDEYGNQTFTYSNPDGTGGGGVALD